MANEFLFYFSLPYCDERVIKKLSTFVWPQLFFCYPTMINSTLKSFLEMKPYVFFFQICIVLSQSLHCGVANGSLKSFPSTCVLYGCSSIHFFYFVTVLRQTGLQKMYTQFISLFVTFFKSHIVRCSIVKNGNIAHQPFHLNFVFLKYFISGLGAWW